MLILPREMVIVLILSLVITGVVKDGVKKGRVTKVWLAQCKVNYQQCRPF